MTIGGLVPTAASALEVAPLGATQNEKSAQGSQRPTSLKSTGSPTPLSIKAECPPTIRCVVAPAAYQSNGGNVADYGNYDIANRPRDMKITSIVIHDGEGSCQDIVDAFKDPTHYASTPYVVCKDGTVYQMVRTQDLPWHAGNWYFNMHSIGIEHEGHAATGGSDYSTNMYWASAQLVKYLTDKFGIPRDREHIIGHDNIPAVKGSQVAGMHYDPGPFWNWQNYMAMMGAPVVPQGGYDSKFVTVAPTWPLNNQPVTGCADGNNGCAPAGLHPTNFVYLRTEPRTDAPFFTDPLLEQGTTELSNNAARLFHGQTFAVADKKLDQGGIWYKVWVNGLSGWFYSSWNAPAGLPASGKYATPKAGKASIPVYGRPVPELSAYPSDLLNTSPASFWIPTLAPQEPLPYAIPAGQKYKVIDADAPNDHFYAWAIDSSFPYDHTVWKGKTKFVEIQYGNRVGFVKADDVTIK